MWVAKIDRFGEVIVMIGKSKIYLADHTSDWGEKLAFELAKLGYDTAHFSANGNVLLQAIRENCPDVVVVEALLSQLSIAEVMRECHTLPHPPKFIVHSLYHNSNLEYQLEKNGADYYILLPVEATMLSQKIDDLCNPNEQSLRMQIGNILRFVGVPASILGYHYLRDSIMLTIENDNAILAVTKQIYPDVAKKYNATSAQVERTIRHAIKTAWKQNVERLNQYFGRTSPAKPTNSEFIAMVADKIRLGMR